jgi:site-specific DNA-methyltransferase (cytosine-N4-specific)
MLEVRPADKMRDDEIALLDQAKLAELAPFEAWSAQGTNRELAYATHGAFRYFGKFPPPIANHLITEYSCSSDYVIDPMCGSGTTGVESLLLGRDCTITDINPLSVLIARVKTRYVPAQDLRLAVQRVVEKYAPVEDDLFSPVGLRNADHWFLPHTTKSLKGLKLAIDSESNEILREFLLVAFAASVRRVSRATTQQGRLFLDATTALEDALPTFLKRADILINGISNLPEHHSRIEVMQHDIQETLPDRYSGKAGLVILHPPYFNAYKYSSINALELAWLGLDVKIFRRGEVREAFKVGKPEKVAEYIDDMVKVMRNTISLLRPGGVLGLMIGDTCIRGSYISVTRMLIDRLADVSVTVDRVALRVPQYTEATWVASQRRTGGNVGVTLNDFIIVFKRRA